MTEIPPVVFLPPTYAHDGDAVDDDVFMMRSESICPLAEWLSNRGNALSNLGPAHASCNYAKRSMPLWL